MRIFCSVVNPVLKQNLLSKPCFYTRDLGDPFIRKFYVVISKHIHKLFCINITIGINLCSYEY